MSPMLPYHFAPNQRPSDTILEELVPHQGSHDGQTLYSGEMQVELTFITPFFTGAGRFKKGEHTFEEKGRDDTDDHTYVAPLTYPAMDVSGKVQAKLPDAARFLIAPSTLKGVYASLVDALTGAPMKRISKREKGISFRLLRNPQRVKAGVLFQVGDDWVIYPAVKGSLPNFRRQRNRAEVTNAVASLDALRQGDFASPPHNRGNRIPENHRWVEAHYDYSDWDRDAERRRRKHTTVLIQVDPDLADEALLPIPERVLNYFDGKAWDRKGLNAPPPLREGQAVFYLTDAAGEVVAISPNFRLKWPYLHTPREINAFHPDEKPRNRDQFGYFANEALNREPTLLTPRQRLFGYTYQDECRHQPHERKDYLEAYAGRVHFNFAVHQPQSGTLVTQPLTLPILGQPQPSAYEHYLQPHLDPKTQARTIADYGLPTLDQEPADLAGRKVYLHQPPVAWNTPTTGETPNQNSTLLAHLRPNLKAKDPFPRFRFTVRFHRLANWEVGMLHHLCNFSASADANAIAAALGQGFEGAEALNELKVHALKLGYARPLGFGSALTKVAKLNLRQADNPKAIPFDAKGMQQAWLDKIDSWFPYGKGKKFWKKTRYTKALDHLLRFRYFENRFPQKVAWKYPSRGGNIFKYHMDIHKEHVEKVLDGSGNLDSPMPPVTKVWEETYDDSVDESS